MGAYQKWINQTFTRRICAYIIPLILALLVTVGLISSYIYYTSIVTERKQSITDTVTQRNFTLDLYFRDVKDTVATLKESEDIAYMLRHYPEMSIVERYYRQERIDELLMNTSLVRDYIQDCIIVGTNGYQVNMPDRYKIRYDLNILQEEWIQPYLGRTQRHFYYTSSHENNYYFYHNGSARTVISVIFPMKAKGLVNGYIIMDMDFAKLNRLISVNQKDSLRYMVVDEERLIVFSDHEEEINEKLPETVFEKLSEFDAFHFREGKEPYYCVHQKSGSTSWDLLGMVDEQKMAEPAIRLLKMLLLIVWPLFIFLTVFLSARIAKRIKEPLGEIVEQMKRVDINRPEPLHVSKSVGEIVYLADKVTEMIERINSLVRLAFEEERGRKDAQIEALISQINPHFLYNTLQLIKTETAIGESGEAISTVNCLSNYLRYTMSNRERYVPLEKEVAHIGYYMEIYKKRFPDKYILETEIDAQAMQVMVPKLILQPLVENAIKHGLRTREGTGLIRIRAKLEDDLYVKVEDNGIGMEEEAAKKLLQKLLQAPETGVHIGLRNVDERIRLTAGDAYGIICIDSKPDAGFALTLKMKPEIQEPSPIFAETEWEEKSYV